MSRRIGQVESGEQTRADSRSSAAAAATAAPAVIRLLQSPQ